MNPGTPETKLKSIFLASEEELLGFLDDSRFEPFRAKQIRNWIFSGKAGGFEEMKNIPATLRSALETAYFCLSSRTVVRHDDPLDGTAKILVRFADGECVENAIIKSPGRTTFCISSQCGCPVGCLFCASGKDGFRRNIEAHEILEEFMHCRTISSSLPDNIVVMGVGEPLMNLDNLLRALDIICSPSGFGLSPRRITISTSGYVPGIIRLAEHGRPWNLAVSLHSADEAVRRKIVPGMKFGIEDIVSACRRYKEATGRIVTVEYVMLDGINCGRGDAEKLALLCRKNGMKINLIPFNPHPFSDLRRPSRQTVAEFEKTLLKCKVPFTRRIEKGGTVRAACGQLMAEDPKKMETKNAG